MKYNFCIVAFESYKMILYMNLKGKMTMKIIHLLLPLVALSAQTQNSQATALVEGDVVSEERTSTSSVSLKIMGSSHDASFIAWNLIESKGANNVTTLQFADWTGLSVAKTSYTDNDGIARPIIDAWGDNARNSAKLNVMHMIRVCHNVKTVSFGSKFEGTLSMEDLGFTCVAGTNKWTR